MLGSAPQKQMLPDGRGASVTVALLGLLAALLVGLTLALGFGRHQQLPARGHDVGLRLQLGDVVATCRVVSDDPVIRVVDDFMTPEECQEIIALYEHELRPSTVADDADPTVNRPNPNRTSWTAFMRPGSQGDLVERIERRVVALTGKPLCNMETLQLVRYVPPGQKYAPHMDYFHNSPESQRTVTCFIYLNDTGGEAPTRFTELGLDVVPKPGRAAVWDNTPAHGRGQLPDRRLEHAGTPVQTRLKFGINCWFRSLPFRCTA